VSIEYAQKLALEGEKPGFYPEDSEREMKK
jgi:hypothetical protein